jgi:hypothetical protein
LTVERLIFFAWVSCVWRKEKKRRSKSPFFMVWRRPAFLPSPAPPPWLFLHTIVSHLSHLWSGRHAPFSWGFSWNAVRQWHTPHTQNRIPDWYDVDFMYLREYFFISPRSIFRGARVRCTGKSSLASRTALHSVRSLLCIISAPPFCTNWNTITVHYRILTHGLPWKI